MQVTLARSKVLAISSSNELPPDIQVSSKYPFHLGMPGASPKKTASSVFTVANFILFQCLTVTRKLQLLLLVCVNLSVFVI